ncbi:MAG: hypothetical protein M0R73_10030 [Dehalococcoidia bacterium]|nr:hypothetical protein [Dehalococcoidia bacterium]
MTIRGIRPHPWELIAFLVAAAMLAAVAFAASPSKAHADTRTENLEALNDLNSGGWSYLGAADGPEYDIALVTNHTAAPDAFGDKSLRISNAVTSGRFEDWVFSAAVSDEAGETDALNADESGGTRQNTFIAEWSFIPTTTDHQEGLKIGIAPTRGDLARMSWVEMEDVAEGLKITFHDTKTDGSFQSTVVASALVRNVEHTVRLEMTFVDGPSNDVVKVYVNDELKHTGTSWEQYYRTNATEIAEAGDKAESRTVDSLMFVARGTAAPATEGKGFLFDNITLTSSTPLDVDYTFTGLGSNTTGASVDYSISVKVAQSGGVDAATLVRYRARLTRGGVGVAGHDTIYPDLGKIPPDDPDNQDDWSPLTTDGNGYVWFGPSTGFSLSYLDTERVTRFNTTFTTPGDYVLTVELFVITGGTPAAEPLAGSTGSTTFKVSAPFIPSDPAPAAPTLPNESVEVEVEDLQETSVPADEPATVESKASDGSTASVTAPAGALPEGSTLRAAAITNIDSLKEQAPPPSDATIALAFSIQAEDSNGEPITEGFTEPIQIDFTVPASSVPENLDHLVLVFWNGTAWVEVAGEVTLNQDGTVTITALVDHFTVFAVMQQPDRGTLSPAPAATGITLTNWRGGGYALLEAALDEGDSAWVFVDGKPIGYIVGAMPSVNADFMARFPGGVPMGTSLVVVTH